MYGPRPGQQPLGKIWQGNGGGTVLSMNDIQELDPLIDTLIFGRARGGRGYLRDSQLPSTIWPRHIQTSVVSEGLPLTDFILQLKIASMVDVFAQPVNSIQES